MAEEDGSKEGNSKGRLIVTLSFFVTETNFMVVCLVGRLVGWSADRMLEPFFLTKKRNTM